MSDEVLSKLLKGEIRLHELDKLLCDSNKATDYRRRFLEKKISVQLENIGKYSVDFNEVVGRNCENTIGVAQIPIGIAGPLMVEGEYAKGEYFIPLATTEGALVASVNRGCKAITLSGGAKVRVIEDKMTRAPLFVLPSIADAVDFVKWVKEHLSDIKAEAEKTTRHGKLVDIEPFIAGNNVWLRFKFTTGDAMGMNMVTIATTRAAEFIEENYPQAKCIAISGNMCVDKKPCAVNFLLGRGKTVVAEAEIRKEIVEKTLRTTAEEIHEVNVRKNLLGSARAFSLGFNAHFANIIAAIFIATGQDCAQIVESSMGITWTEVRDGNLYISVTLPSLEVGTVGGGTRLPTQREALRILGCEGSGDPPGSNALKLAEIIAAAVLAGELNLLAVLASRTLAKAHIKLGRKGKNS
ncbi:MAG: hydroxymethylglutaryl-CoA reductase (NADPH) [Thermoprotei archaeon]|nr:MAG: hydroxymethylglutaryl-CoA reductase (NADPH) [Thermoprotei archaeon]RLF00414.1 MAG: hydroxymethylglutaryl-CoA reductase (NADPH) [Thermoprotei archaeon]HDI74984.1 hydroxymethylglutaryl-CoA reductase (NADPH) [Thermoprotei archaeon]